MFYIRDNVRNDKKEAQSESQILCASYDLQKVLNAPHGEISSFYYKRKLSIYNFTVFDLNSKEAECFLWNETAAKRGANEIWSCLWKYIVNKSRQGTLDFRFCSDNCGGQNKNQILYTMYTKAAISLGVTISHR